jgi:3-oxoacyl-[acyl-carrier-protein] synthase-1
VAPIHIIGLGASTPIGRTAWASAAAARAGICGFFEHPFMIDTIGEPMRVASAPWIDVEVQGMERFSQLLLPAIEEALAPLAGASGAPLTVGLTVALPQPRPGLPAELPRQLSDAIAARFPQRFSRIVTYPNGHAAGYLGLDGAFQSLDAGSTQACVVAGVDSYLAPETLEWIEAEDQFHGAGPLNNAWGFIPGEAAGALLLSTVPIVEQREMPVLGELLSVGLGRETNVIKSESVCIGEGLTTAIRAALSALGPGERVDNVYCDLNGETYRADEYGFTTLRVKEWFRSAADFVAPADCWGDVGAAGAPLHGALAVIAGRKGYAKGPLSMIWASSESGERGAAVVRAALPER